MSVGNVQIVTLGWYSSVAADTPGSVPDGEEIHTFGWCDGVVAGAPPSITRMANYIIKAWPIIPKRYRGMR